MKTRTKITRVAIVVIFFLVITMLLAQYYLKLETKAMAPQIAMLPSKTMAPLTVPTKMSNRLTAIDKILESLEIGKIAFNSPKSVNLHDTAKIQLMLGLAREINELKQMIKAEGEKEGADIRVSDRMEARLSGSNFAITAITPETQAVSRSELTEWNWEIKPTSKGRQYLHLTLSAIISVDGSSISRAIRTFDKVIEVEVTWHQRIGSILKDNWQWLWAAVLVPLAGWLWRKKMGAKPSGRQKEEK